MVVSHGFRIVGGLLRVSLYCVVGDKVGFWVENVSLHTRAHAYIGVLIRAFIG